MTQRGPPRHEFGRTIGSIYCVGARRDQTKMSADSSTPRPVWPWGKPLPRFRSPEEEQTFWASWEDLGKDRTRMTLRNRGEPSGFSRIVGPIMAAAMRRANRKDLARLKTLLERT